MSERWIWYTNCICLDANCRFASLPTVQEDSDLFIRPEDKPVRLHITCFGTFAAALLLPWIIDVCCMLWLCFCFFFCFSSKSCLGGASQSKECFSVITHRMMLPKTNQESRFWRSACVSPHFIQPHCSSVIIPTLSQSALKTSVAICKRKCLPPWIKATVEHFGKADLDTSWKAVWLLRTLEKKLWQSM